MFAAVVLFAGVASAQTFKTGQNTNVAGSEVIDSAAYLSGNTVDVAGTINGDLYCAGQTVNISGTVNGDIFCAGQTVNFSGTASGSVRFAGQTVNISGKANSASIMAQTANLSDTATITQDVNGGASTFTVSNSASIGRDLAYGASDIVINGMVGRDVKVGVEKLTLGSSAKVGGNVAYTSNNAVTKDAGASVVGTVTQTVPKQESKPSYSFGVAASLSFAIYMFFAILVLLLALVGLFPSVYKESAARIGKSPWMTLLIGFIAAITVPVLLIVIAITIIGLPIAIVLGLMWLLVVMLSGSFTAFYIGSLMLSKKSPLLVMLAGGAVLLVLYFIPFIGFLAAMVSTALGIGIILRELMRRTPKPKY
jgi:cytoskeletal protein CcmA (bactofilin family)